MRRRPDSSSWIAAALVPAGRGDHVAQHGRVVAGLLGEAGAALERLDDEVVGDVAREAEVDGRVDQRLHDEEHVGRAGARDRGRHRDPLLVLDLELRAERAEQRLRLGALVLGAWRASRTRRSCRRRCGRACWASRGRPGRGRAWRRAPPVVGPARTDRTSWPGRRCGPISRPTLAEHLRLDREDDRRPRRRPPPRSRRRCGSRASPPSAARRSARGWLATTWSGRDEVAAEQPDDHGLGHDAGADGRDGAVREG